MSAPPTIIDANGIQVITADDNATISIGPTGLKIVSGLVSGPLIEGQLGYNGFSTTNPNGIEFQSKLNMNANEIVASDPITGSNINIANDQILMVDGSDPNVTQCSIRGSRIRFEQTQFPNRTLTLDPDLMSFTNGAFLTELYGGGVSVQAPGQGQSFLGSGGIFYTQTGTGGQANPSLILSNTNTTGSVSMEVYKNKPGPGAAGDVLFNQSVYGKDNGSQKQEFTRISHTLRDAAVGGEDGSIEFSAFVNGSVNTFLQINGNENEINCLKNLDLTGNSIRTTTGGMNITTVGSSGSGDINISGKSGSIMTLSATQINLNSTGGNHVNLNSTGDVSLNAANQLIFNGPNLQSNNSGGNSGEYLVISLNGNIYKIKLELP
jgi:hypothetical protein